MLGWNQKNLVPPETMKESWNVNKCILVSVSLSVRLPPTWFPSVPPDPSAALTPVGMELAVLLAACCWLSPAWGEHRHSSARWRQQPSPAELLTRSLYGLTSGELCAPHPERERERERLFRERARRVCGGGLAAVGLSTVTHRVHVPGAGPHYKPFVSKRVLKTFSVRALS